MISEKKMEKLCNSLKKTYTLKSLNLKLIMKGKINKDFEKLSCLEKQRKLIFIKIVEDVNLRYSNTQNDKVLSD